MQRTRRVVKVTRRGQTTIPVEIRKRFGIEEGSRLVVETDDDAIVMRPIGRLEDLAGFLASAGGEERARRIIEESREEEE